MKKIALFATVLCLMIGTAMAQSPVKSTSAQKTAVKVEKKDTKTAMPAKDAVAKEKTAGKKCCSQKNAEHMNCARAAATEQHKNCAAQCGNHANAQKAPMPACGNAAQKKCAKAGNCHKADKAGNCPKTAKADKQNTNSEAVSK